jgi:predicted RNase H-like HicB family nuclease
MTDLTFRIETEEETDGRWIAEIPDLPGVMAYGATKVDAIAAVEALALRVIADQISKSVKSPRDPFPSPAREYLAQHESTTRIRCHSEDRMEDKGGKRLIA